MLRRARRLASRPNPSEGSPVLLVRASPFHVEYTVLRRRTVVALLRIYFYEQPTSVTVAARKPQSTATVEVRGTHRNGRTRWNSAVIYSRDWSTALSPA